MAKIIFLTFPELEVFGGKEKWLIDVGRKLSRDFDIIIFAPKKTFNWRVSREEIFNMLSTENNSIKYYPILHHIIFRSIYEIPISYSILKKIKFDEKEDYIWINDWWSYKLFLIKYLLKNRRNIIITDHGSLSNYVNKIRVKQDKLKILYLSIIPNKKLLKVHVVANFMKKIFKSFGFKNVDYIPNFVNSKEFYYPQKIKEFIVLFLGRLEKVKGIDLLLEIIKKVLEKNKEIKFWICGSGDPYYENLIKKLEKKYPENVKYFGFILGRKKAEILSKSSLFLVPSRTEGQPIAVLEALVSGSPFLGSNIVAFRDLIKLYDKNFGWIVKEYNPEAFAEKILEIYQKWKENPEKYFEKRKYVARRARELFDIEKVVKEFEEKLLK